MQYYWERKSGVNVSFGGGAGRQKGKPPNICAPRNYLRTSQPSAFSCYPPNPAPTEITALRCQHWKGLEVGASSQTAVLQLIFCQASYSTSERKLEDVKVAVRTMKESVNPTALSYDHRHYAWKCWQRDGAKQHQTVRLIIHNSMSSKYCNINSNSLCS